MTAKLSFIIAVAENGVIGRDGKLPWRLSSDLKLFRKLTMGKPVIMGRRTWESLFRQPLDGRDNIVVTRDRDFRPVGALPVSSCQDALELGRRKADERCVDEIMVIGGALVYQALLASADRIYWTSVHAEPDGDTWFPAHDRAQWTEVSRQSLPRTEADDFAATLKILERVPRGE